MATSTCAEREATAASKQGHDSHSGHGANDHWDKRCPKRPRILDAAGDWHEERSSGREEQQSIGPAGVAKADNEGAAALTLDNEQRQDCSSTERRRSLPLTPRPEVAFNGAHACEYYKSIALDGSHATYRVDGRMRTRSQQTTVPRKRWPTSLGHAATSQHAVAPQTLSKWHT